MTRPIILSKPGYGTITVTETPLGEWSWEVDPAPVVMPREDWAEAGWDPK